MWASARWSLIARQHPLLLSAATSTVLFAAVMLSAGVKDALGTRQPLSWTVSAVVYAVLVAHRRFPLAAVAIATIGSVVLMAAGMKYPLTLPALFCALYWFTLGSTLASTRRLTLTVGAPVKATLLTAALITHPGITGFVVLLWTSLALALAIAVRSHRAYVAEVEERARRAEQAKEDEANRRVAEERLRIARELHDVVGHHVALISVQAGALACLLDEDQTRARESVSHIQRASEEALEDLRLTVGLLREPGAREPVEPVPGLDRLEELICSFAGAGLRVTREVTGLVRPLPEAVELTAYRVIQESLTNTRKHAGCGTAVVRLGYAPATLRLAVEDEGKPVARNGRRAPEGHGIVGMRERVAALGGRLTAGPRPEGGYRVLAELPLRTVGLEGS